MCDMTVDLKEESIEFIDALSETDEQPELDLDTPLLKAAKSKDFASVLELIREIDNGGKKDGPSQLLYAFFSGPLTVPTSDTDDYGRAYAQIKQLAQRMFTEQAFGTQDQPRDPPLTSMEVAFLRDAEVSPVLGKQAQAYAMAALSSASLPPNPREEKVVHKLGQRLQRDFLSGTPEDRLGKNGISRQIARDSLEGPVSMTGGRVTLSDRPPLSGYTLDKVIGKGISGNVALGTNGEDLPVVIKKIRLDPKKREESIDNVLRESALQMFLRESTGEDPIVCRLEEVIITGDSAYVVMEACDGTLTSRLEKHPPTLDEAVELLAQLGDMLSQMHKLGITHRDIKADNVLVKGEQLFLSDFGMSKSHHPSTSDKPLKEKGSRKEKEELLVSTSPSLILLDDDTEGLTLDPGSNSSKESLADDARKFGLMILEQLEQMPNLSATERRALPGFRSSFSVPQYAKCLSYEPPKPNCFARCCGATNDPTLFSSLINLIGKLGTEEDPQAMARSAKRLRALLIEFGT